MRRIFRVAFRQMNRLPGWIRFRPGNVWAALSRVRQALLGCAAPIVRWNLRICSDWRKRVAMEILPEVRFLLPSSWKFVLLQGYTIRLMAFLGCENRSSLQSMGRHKIRFRR